MAYADGCYVGKRVKIDLLSRRAGAPDPRVAPSTCSTTVGVTFHSKRALDILAEHGADGRLRDHRRQAARRRCASGRWPRMPEQFVLGARNPEYDLPLDGEHVYISSDGCGLSVPRLRRRDPPVAQGGPRRTAPRSCRRCPTCRPPRPSSRPRTARSRRACCTSSTPACATPRSTRIVVCDQGGLGGAQPHPHGRGDGRRQRGAAPPADVHGHHLHRLAAAPGALRHGPGAHPGRGRHPGQLLPHAHPRRHRPGHDRRLGGRQQRRARQRHRAHAARLPRRQGHPRRRPDGDVHELGRLREQLARGHPAARRAGPHGRLLPHAGLVRRRRHHRQGAGRAVAPTRTRSP